MSFVWQTFSGDARFSPIGPLENNSVRYFGGEDSDFCFISMISFFLRINRRGLVSEPNDIGIGSENSSFFGFMLTQESVFSAKLTFCVSYVHV